MTLLLGLVPAAAAALLWAAFWRLNRRIGWFTIGEMLFWDVIFLIVLQLVWLRWF